jgi:aminoacyl tRNA synthase complex-interacting multifunctional protein 1
MSFQATLSKISSPVKELVAAVTDNGTRHIGETEKDQKEVVDWVEKTVQPDVTSTTSIQVCTWHSESRDIVLYR